MKKLSIIFATLLLFAASSVMARDFYTGFLSSSAIKGYDVVAYFNDQAIEGKKELSYEYEGATWRFSTEANLNAFKKNPNAYLPQYNGYCAYAMSAKGKKVSIDPEQYTVKDGKLYLNYSASVSEKFKADVDNHIIQANKNWVKFADE